MRPTSSGLPANAQTSPVEFSTKKPSEGAAMTSPTPVLDTPTPPPAPTRREPSRPGWVGTVAVAAGAAVLAGLGTVGALNAFGSPAGTATSATSAPAQQSVPLVKGGTTIPD